MDEFEEEQPIYKHARPFGKLEIKHLEFKLNQ